MTDVIFVEGLTFVGHHGVTPRERRQGHHLLVDVAACCDARRAAERDELRATVDHEQVARIVHELGTSSSLKLLETLAQRIAKAILAATPADRVEVRVRKLKPTLPGMPLATGVVLARDREGAAQEPHFLRL